ncbi:MAG: 4Fe-4S binding protein [Dehalococcoidia bacterium]
MEEIKTGVYICHCGLNIAGVVNVEEVAKYAGTLPNVVVSRDYRYMCSDPGQDLIKNDIKKLGLNRVVVASCSPRMHEPTFRKAVADGGLNLYLYEHANIREHCSWVHDDRKLATEKAKDLVRAAVSRVYYHEPLMIKEVPLNPNVLVIGGGIAGMQAALDIANGQNKVYLVEKDPSIGGHMIQLDRTFPTLDCSECILTPKMADVGHHPFIELFTYSEVEEVSGSIGNFKVKIRKKARYVDVSKCVGCGVCEEKCPWKVDSEFEMGLGKRGVIYIPFAQAIPNAAIIDKERCVYFLKGKCRACESVCDANAIDFEQEDEIVGVEVGTIIVATGYDQFDPSVIPQYGYKKYDNVLTGLEFERITCAAGPTEGRILLKDGREPESVAIVHCVGSRDQNYHEYCSRVCCMYGLKYAHLIKELTKADIYEFYIDMRCFGEGYEEFYKRLSEEGVNFIRGKVAKITNEALIDEEKGKLIVVSEDTLLGRLIRVPVDMVILCCALEARSDAENLAKLLNINRRADGFFLERHVKLDPVATPTDGIFIAGCCEGPRDIPDTVAQAEATAAKALSLISKGTVTLEASTAVIDEALCSGCRICNLLCPYSAISFDEERKISKINEALCKGCGTCVAACPSRAITHRQFTDEQILAQIQALLSK